MGAQSEDFTNGDSSSFYEPLYDGWEYQMVNGVVGSAGLPVGISRETLQRNMTGSIITDDLVNTRLEMRGRRWTASRLLAECSRSWVAGTRRLHRCQDCRALAQV